MPTKIGGSLASAGKCVVCGKPYKITLKEGPEAPSPYVKGNKSGYAHNKCIKGDKGNAPVQGGK